MKLWTFILCCSLLANDAISDDKKPAPESKSGEQGSIDLRPRFIEGRKMPYVLEQKTVTARGSLRQVVAMKTKQMLTTGKVDAKGATLNLEYTACSIALANPATSLSYDSENPKSKGSSPALASLVGAFVGQKLKIETSPAAEVRRVHGIEAILKSPQGQALAQFIDEDVLKRTLNQVFRPAPTKDLVVMGESWSEEQVSKFDEVTNLVVTKELKVSERKGDLISIEIKGKAQFRGSRPRVRLSFKVKKQEIHGFLVWDQKRRLLLQHQLTQKIEIEHKTPTGETETMTVSQESRTRLDEKSKTKLKP